MLEWHCCQNLRKNSENNIVNFANFQICKISQKFWQRLGFDKKNEITELCKGVRCVDLGESFPTHIFLQNLASIQPKTSPVKFARSIGAASRFHSPPGHGSSGATSSAQVILSGINFGGFANTDRALRALCVVRRRGSDSSFVHTCVWPAYLRDYEFHRLASTDRAISWLEALHI